MRKFYPSLVREFFSGNKKYVLFIFLFKCSLTLFAQPTIISFSPTSGPIGTMVTITGNNFDTNPIYNTVFFGAVKATVMASTATTITVKVPAGATFQPITVTCAFLTAYSAKPFVVTFPGAASEFSSTSFEYSGRVDSVASGIETTKYTIGDINNDGRIDVVTIDNLANRMTVYINTTNGGNVSFADGVIFSTGSRPRSVAVGDVNNDGRLDIIVTNFNSNTVSVFKNTSFVYPITFDPKVDFATAFQPAGISVADIDNDGKSDLVINTINLEGYVSVLRNTTTFGPISFAPKIDIQSVGGSLENITVGDIDGDSKPEIAVPNYLLGTISIFRNTSTTGNISFSSKIDIKASGNPDAVNISDLNDDGKPDMSVNYSLVIDKVSIFRNNSSVGNISFATPINLSNGNGNTADDMTVSDLDGDGKPDLAVQSTWDSLSVFKNISASGGAIQFRPFKKMYVPHTGPIFAGDFDGDGRPDITFLAGVFRVMIWKNKTTFPQIASVTPLQAISGNTITISGVNFNGVTSVSFGGTAASSFTVENDTTIKAVVGNGASGDITVTAPHGIGKKSGFIFASQPTIKSFTPISGGNGTTVTIAGTNFTGTTSVSFGNKEATSFIVSSDTRITAVVNNGSSGNVKVTTPGGIATLPGFNYTGPTIFSFSPTTGGIGTIITITGSNFTGANLVSFGGTSADSFTVVNDTTITAKVGIGSTGDLLVNTTSGIATLSGFIYLGPSILSFTPVGGKAGTIVTLTGTNFTGATSVNFGDTPAASFTVVNATTITAVVGLGSSGNVSVRTPLGVSTSSGFTYTGPPVITSFTPFSDGPGTTITISGAHFTGATSVTFGGIAAASFVVVNPTTITAVVSTGASGNVSVTTIYGTVSLPGFTFIPLPRIFSFSPSSGTVGTSVTITGENFSTTQGNNIVYFGPVRATVNSSTASSIIVTVPPGASYLPLAVTVDKLTAYSANPFIVTYEPGGGSLNTNSFGTKVDYISDGSSKKSIAVGDLNNDGWSDLVVGARDVYRINIFKNQSTAGNILLASKIDIATPFAPTSVAVGDINGDGKLDIATANLFSNNISVLINSSRGTDISFLSPVNFSAGGEPHSMNVTDIDKDGKPDILISNLGSLTVSLFRNITSNGIIAFAPKVDLFSNSYQVHAGDIDDDSKTDLVVIAPGDRLLFYRNLSAPGNVVFSAPIEIVSGLHHDPTFVAFGDLDGDNKPDIAVGNHVNFSFSVLRNTSSTGSISFATRQDFVAGHNYTKNISIGDIDGDGKPDLALQNVDRNTVSLFRNASTFGSIVLENPVKLTTLVGPEWVTITDLDNDSRPDIIAASHDFPKALSIFKNQFIPPALPTIASFTPVSAVAGETVTIAGTNLNGTKSVSFGGVAATSFTVNSSTSITATVGAGASGNVSVTTAGGTATLAGFTFISAPTITSFTPTYATSGATATITGTNLTGATAVSFGGTPATSFTVNSATSITATVGTGASGNVSVSTPGGTATLAGFTFVSSPTITSITPSSAASGATVTITGINLTSATAVSFGGTPATSFTVNSATSITATVGAGASGNVSVTTPGGTATLGGFTFIVQPTIISFTPTTGGAGASLTITGSNLTGATVVSFGGIAASFTVNSPTSITAVVGTGSSGNVSVTTPAGTATLAGFTFMSPPAITSFTPEKGRSGVTVAITGTSFNETTAVSFGGVPAASFIINSSTSISAVVAAGASGDITVSTPYGVATAGGFAFEAGRGVNELVIYPNPADEFVLVKHPSTDRSAQLKVIDLTGKVVKVIIPERNASETRIDLKGLQQGIYEVVWSDGKNKASQKLILYK